MKIYCSVSVVAVACASMAGTAHAQNAQPAEEGAAAPAKAEFGEILVTATRRSEKLQNVPISVSALPAIALKQASINTVADLGQQTPGLNIASYAGGLTVFIRGIGSGEGGAGQEASVATYVDGVYISSPQILKIGLNNVERVEVLKGPQGTLFGRNATGGLIQIITRDPKQETTVEASGYYGMYRTVDGRFYGTTGLAENLAADLSVTYRNQMDGFGHNITSGADINRERELNVRSKWMWTGAVTTIKVTGDYSDFYYSSGAARQLYPDTTSAAGTGRPGNSGNFYDVIGDFPAYYDGSTWGVSGRVDQELGDVASLVSITAYREANLRGVFDSDYTVDAYANVDINREIFRTFTQELQLVSGPSSAVKWIVGGFYMHDRSGYGPPYGIGIFGGQVAFAGGAIGITGEVKTRAYSGFAEATVPLGSETNLTVGGRYSVDEREVDGAILILDPATNTQVATIPAGGPYSQTFKRPTWRAILDHHFTDDTMFYASYSRGFKSGNFSASNPGPSFVDPEKVDTFEIGTKNELFGRMLTLNVSAFYNTYDNIQLPVLTGVTIDTVNAGSATTKGFEIEGNFRPTDAFNVGFGLAFLDTNIKRFDGAVCFRPNPDPTVGGSLTLPCGTDNTSPGGLNVGGNRLPRAPQLTLNLSPSYTVDAGGGSLRLSAAYSYTSTMYWDASNFRKNEPVSILNARIQWTDPSDHYTVALVGRNLFDIEYRNFVAPGAVGDAFSAAPPRTVGIEVGARF